MNNDEIYIEMKCDACGQNAYNIQTCNTCKKHYCRYKCTIDKMGSAIQNNLICKYCYREKLK